jgi:hypothetical protein
MSDGYITIVGVDMCFGKEIFKVGQILTLRKDFDNRYDDEAIEAVLDSVGGRVGYVANSCHTVARGTKSSGRIYDTFNDICSAKVAFIAGNSVIAELVLDKEIVYEDLHDKDN